MDFSNVNQIYRHGGTGNFSPPAGITIYEYWYYDCKQQNNGKFAISAGDGAGNLAKLQAILPVGEALEFPSNWILIWTVTMMLLLQKLIEAILSLLNHIAKNISRRGPNIILSRWKCRVKCKSGKWRMSYGAIRAQQPVDHQLLIRFISTPIMGATCITSGSSIVITEYTTTTVS